MYNENSDMKFIQIEVMNDKRGDTIIFGLRADGGLNYLDTGSISGGLVAAKRGDWKNIKVIHMDESY